MWACGKRYDVTTEGRDASQCIDDEQRFASRGVGSCEDFAGRHCRRGSLPNDFAGDAADAAAAAAHCCLCGRWRDASATLEPPDCWDRRLDNPGVPWGASPFCPSWPAYRNRSQLSAATLQLVRSAARHALRPFTTAGGIRRDAVRSAARRHCAQRLCLLVQIVGGQLFVVAPRGMRLCPEGKQCGHRSLRGERWPTGWSPTALEWHVAAGLNMSTCATGVRRGDYNGAFTRLRLLTALRLLHAAAARGAADTELLLCLGEVAINAGGWCLKGAQPVFASTGNAQHALIPFVHWMAGLRDFELAVWDEVREEQRRAYDAATAATATATTDRERVAVFRGGVYRLCSYSADWRRDGASRTQLAPTNWREAHRTALLRCKLEEPAEAARAAGGGAGESSTRVRSVLNVHLRHESCGARCSAWAEALQVPDEALAAMDGPPLISLREQARRFAYAVNAEGHGGWADRLYQLLLSPLTVVAQDLPFRLWYEHALRAGRHFVPVDSALRNLTAVVRRLNGRAAAENDAISRHARWAVGRLVSVGAIHGYVDELLQGYTRLLRPAGTNAAIALHPRAVRLSCAPTGECRECMRPRTERPSDAPPSAASAETAATAGQALHGESRSVCGIRCVYVVGAREFSTLFEAAQTAFPA